jgi:hypothetical protein
MRARVTNDSYIMYYIVAVVYKAFIDLHHFEILFSMKYSDVI